MNIPTLDLKTPSGSVPIPQVGYGTWEVSPEDVERMVPAAIEAGYRHIDTAAIYQNEEAVGKGITASGIDRSELFVTSKLWNNQQGEPLVAFDQTMERLGLDYLDLYLIHWPWPTNGQFVDAWHGLREIRDSGRVKVIGVSNFLPEHLQAVYDATGEWPAINQIELHPHYPQAEAREFHHQHGIVTESWSPLAQGGELLRNETVAQIAAKHEISPAQVLLGWNVQLGNVVLPRTTKAERLVENADLFSFNLDRDDLAALTGLDTGIKVGANPLEFPKPVE